MSILSEMLRSPEPASPFGHINSAQRRHYAAKRHNCITGATILALDRVNRLNPDENKREALLLKWTNYYTDKLAGPAPRNIS